MGTAKKESLDNSKQTLVKAKITDIRFPEFCPVCMEEAEDLVALSVFTGPDNRWDERKGLLSGWARGEDKVDIALAQARGVTTFWVPACLIHGSGSISTTGKKVMSIAGFMFLFYPLLYFLLGLIVAIEYSRPILDSLIPALLLVLAIIIDIAYGFFPRPLERSVRFLSVDDVKDEVVIHIKNPAYRDLFLNENSMTSELLKEEDRKA